MSISNKFVACCYLFPTEKTILFKTAFSFSSVILTPDQLVRAHYITVETLQFTNKLKCDAKLKHSHSYILGSTTPC